MTTKTQTLSDPDALKRPKAGNSHTGASYKSEGDSVPDQFCLSDEVILLNQKMNGIECDVYTEEDVKEFLRRLKDFVLEEPRINRFKTDLILNKIDKLAGEELTK